MPGDASTLPLRESPLGVRVRLARRLRRHRAGTATGARAGVGAGAIAMGALVGLSLVVVLMAANRPSLLSPTTHANYYPRWMAGPLGGLLPWLTGNGTTLKYLFTGAIVL